MEKYFNKVTPPGSTSLISSKRKTPYVSTSTEDNVHSHVPVFQSTSNFTMPNNIVDLDNLPCDPADRPRILSYNVNQRDEIRRRYWLKGPNQPSGHILPQTTIGNKQRCFISAWFSQYGNWLEYSVKTDKAFCLCCYLFRDHIEQQAGNDAFVTEGFNSWNKTERLLSHVGAVNSFHNRALKKCEDLVKQQQSIPVAFHKHSESAKKEYRIRLNASVEVCRHLLNGSLPFRGHDESATSLHRGQFLETLKLIRKFSSEVREVTLENAPGNNQVIAPKIQKHIAYCFSQEILKAVFDGLGKDVFALLVDESNDVSKKEQMAVVLRYVDGFGLVKERFIGVVHVTDTSSKSLKSSIDSLFAQHGLSMEQIRGQGYDGASNMRGEFNGLKALILKDNASAFYIHCFAHQLQLVVVAVARNHNGVGNFFEMLSLVMNVVCASCQRKDMIREGYKKIVQEAIGNNEIETGKGLNQELSLIRAGDTRWGSHYKTISSLVSLFPEVLKVLEYVEKEGKNNFSRNQAHGVTLYFETFDFVFYLHFMLRILELTNMLSQALQKKDQGIIEAVSLIQITKKKLQSFRDDGFEGLLEEVHVFCEKYEIEEVDMEAKYARNRRQNTDINNQHHYKVDTFIMVLDMQLEEFRDRFSELIKLSMLYPNDFTEVERRNLAQQLDFFYDVVKEDDRFANLNGISDLSRVMVETRKHISYYLVYRLVKLALVLPVATATVERCFSAMKLVKSDLRNRIANDFLNANNLWAGLLDQPATGDNKG
ncbi:hypothetical protein L2E82_48297 [Cichorium intybus]|uniref:Uncharacterized protein n=1 Tax=Cichorium intybus TaxID=13427 RepID=A0ACB8YXS4_CICIN|nr:hypothetical protein L2E82_48297 [Cichorium intybus]